jgi:hypothetical protein
MHPVKSQYWIPANSSTFFIHRLKIGFIFARLHKRCVPSVYLYLRIRTSGNIVVADQIYRGRFLFASKNCENNKNTDFATLFLVVQQRKNKRKLADVNVNKR